MKLALNKNKNPAIIRQNSSLTQNKENKIGAVQVNKNQSNIDEQDGQRLILVQNNNLLNQALNNQSQYQAQQKVISNLNKKLSHVNNKENHSALGINTSYNEMFDPKFNNQQNHSQLNGQRQEVSPVHIHYHNHNHIKVINKSPTNATGVRPTTNRNSSQGDKQTMENQRKKSINERSGTNVTHNNGKQLSLALSKINKNTQNSQVLASSQRGLKDGGQSSKNLQKQSVDFSFAEQLQQKLYHQQQVQQSSIVLEDSIQQLKQKSQVLYFAYIYLYFFVFINLTVVQQNRVKNKQNNEKIKIILSISFCIYFFK